MQRRVPSKKACRPERRQAFHTNGW
jgi:hypothetical protein